MTRVYVSIGSNVDKENNICRALRALTTRFGPLEQSAIYETRPVGFNGDNFLNLVVAFNTSDGLDTVSETLTELEQCAGRQRHVSGFMPRTLDLDLLLFGDLIRHDASYDLPRWEIQRYAYVLQPLAEIAPDQLHPELGVDFKTLMAKLDLSDQSLQVVTLDCRD